MHELASSVVAQAAASGQPPPPPGPPTNQLLPAWALLAILAVIVTALLGLVLLTLVRVILRRSVMRGEAEDGYMDPPTAAWQIAGRRADPAGDTTIGADEDKD